MFLCIHVNNFNKKHILINNKIRNNIITDSYFYRLYYSNENFISNGIVIHFPFKDISIEKYFNKKKIIFCPKKNKNIIDKLINFEEQILNSLNIEEKKQKKFLLKEQLLNHYLKIFNERSIDIQKDCEIILKISGIWESVNEYGLTFRCIKSEKKIN